MCIVKIVSIGTPYNSRLTQEQLGRMNEAKHEQIAQIRFDKPQEGITPPCAESLSPLYTKNGVIGALIVYF